MNYLNRLLAVALAAFFIAGSAFAQNPGTVTNHAFVLGKGAGKTGYTSLLCGSAQLAVGQSAADPICQTVTGDVTITSAGVTAIGTAKVTSAMLRNSAALSVIGRSANSSGVPADITCVAASDAVLRESGSVLGCGTIATAGLADAAVTYAKIQNLAALSLMGRAANSSGVGANISAVAASDCVYRESGSALGCGTVATAGIAANAVTLAKLATQAANTTLSNATSGAAVPTAFAMPSCSTSASALNWTTSTGFGCNSAISVAVANVTGLGTGVATALAVNIGSAGAFVAFNGALGTPSSGTGTNLTGIPTTALTGALQAAQEPAHTGDVTNSAASLALTIAANAVTNAKAAQMAAYTIKGNSTGSTANAGDISIPALTQKASPAGADYVMIADSAASNALKYALVSSLASAGSVSSIAGNTGAFTLSTGITNSTNDIRLDKATAANLEAGTSNKALTADNIFDAEVTVTFAASQTLDFNTFLNARITATANTTSLTCSNIKASQSGVITWVQDGTGSRTMVAGWCSQFRWAGGTRGVLSTAINAIDALFYQCISTTICYVSLGKAQAN